MRLLILPLLLTAIFACSFTPEEVSEDRQSRQNLADDPAITLKQFQIDDFVLHYAEAGEPGLPTIVFIHGTPGSWRSLGRLLTNEQLSQQARLIAIDRPGWGGSLLSDKRSEANFDAQVALIEPLLRRLKQEGQNQPLILVGHSYGGSISPYIAYRYPDLVDGILMAASAIDPELGKPRWYNRAASIWPISRLLNERLMIANDEIWGVHEALVNLEPWWQTTSMPMVFLQGEDDELVYPENLDFAESVLPQNNTKVVRLTNQGHLLHIQQRELMTALVLELLEKIGS